VQLAKALQVVFNHRQWHSVWHVNFHIAAVTPEMFKISLHPCQVLAHWSVAVKELGNVGVLILRKLVAKTFLLAPTTSVKKLRLHGSDTHFLTL
jgi:hypothetical protein